MPEYIIAQSSGSDTYKGGNKPASKEEGGAQMARWNAWTKDLGDAVVNPGTPLSGNRIVSAEGVSDDGGENSMSGFNW